MGSLKAHKQRFVRTGVLHSRIAPVGEALLEFAGGMIRAVVGPIDNGAVISIATRRALELNRLGQKILRLSHVKRRRAILLNDF